MKRRKKHQLAKHGARIILGAFMLFAGLAHLTFARRAFQAQVPNWIPIKKDSTVLYSGYIEIVLGVLIIFAGHHRRSIPWLLTVFFILVFPGNVAQYFNHRDAFGLNSDTSRFIRLLFQPILIVWALWSMHILPIGAEKYRAVRLIKSVTGNRHAY